MQLRPPSVNGCRKGAGHGSSGTPECSGSQFPHGMDQRRSGAPLPRRSRLQGAHENVRRRTAPSVLLIAAILRQPSILRNVIRPLATRLPSRISAVASWSRSVTEIAVPACTAMASGWHPLRHSSGLEIPVAQSLLRKLPPARRASNMLLCLTGGRPMEGNFTLAKIRATVETGAMLLPGDQTDRTHEQLRAKLKRLALGRASCRERASVTVGAVTLKHR